MSKTQYTVKDENPFAEDKASREMMRKAFADVQFEDFFSAQDEAYRRSFINSCIPSAIYNPQGEFLGRCLDGHWAAAREFAA